MPKLRIVMKTQIIHLRRDAPSKPPIGTPCNGYGVCCAAEPCPVGRLRFLQSRGPCPGLEWQDMRYACGLLARPRAYMRWLPPRWEALARRALARWIAAGAGCDSNVTGSGEAP